MNLFPAAPTRPHSEAHQTSEVGPLIFHGQSDALDGLLTRSNSPPSSPKECLFKKLGDLERIYECFFTLNVRVSNP